MKRFIFLGLALAAASCGGDDKKGEEEGEPPTIDCTTAPAITFDKVTVFQGTCVTCHSSLLAGEEARQEAPPEINFDVYEQAKASARLAAVELYESDRGAMPPEDSNLPVATEAQKVEVNTWAQCGTLPTPPPP